MEMVRQLFKEHAGTFTDALSAAGFSAEQAKAFLPDAASSLINATENMDIDQVITAFTSRDKTELLAMLKPDAISAKHGLDNEKVSQGMSSIVSTASELFVSNSGVTGALSSLTDSAGTGDGMLNMAKKLFS